MCGIAGVWSQRSLHTGEPSEVVCGMLDCLQHRGPDDSGSWTGAAGLVLGHRRLAVIDCSSRGHQPMVSADGRFTIVFNGEIYNFLALRRELEQLGHQFRSDSDTEVLLEGYAAWGEALLDRLVGMFAFALHDGPRDLLFLARDRAGEKPLFFSHGAWGFAFASEVAAMARVPQVSRQIDSEAVALYLSHQYIPAPRSIYREVRKLPPAHALRVHRDGRVEEWRYWDPTPFATAPRLDVGLDEAVTHLGRLLDGAVRGQMIADVPLGAFLSGGIDSTAVVSAMLRAGAGPVKTFTIGFEAERFNEAEHARAVAHFLGTEHTEEYLTERDALELIPRLPAMYGEPFADSSALPTHLVSAVARKHVTVSLSGDGGDEAFGGYTRYTWLERFATLNRVGAGSVSRALERFLPNAPDRVQRAGRLLGFGPAETYRRILSVFEPEDVSTLTGLSPAFDEFDRAWAASKEAPLRRRAMLCDLLTYLPEAILVKVDRAAMAVSLETRAPLLDHRILEFGLQLPAPLVREKRVLKSLVYRTVPKPLLDRPKQGFGVPLAAWFRGALRSTLQDVVTAERLERAGIGGWGLVQRMMSEHQSGTRDHSARLWSLFVLCLWIEGQK